MSITNFGQSETSILPKEVYQRTIKLLAEEANETLQKFSTSRAIERILAMLEEYLFLNMGRVLLLDSSNKYLRIRYAHGLPTEKRFVTYKLDEGITGFIFLSGQPMYADDLDTNNMYIGKLLKPIDLPYSNPAFSGVPIFDSNNKIIGVLCVNHGYRNAYETNTTLNLLEETAKLIGQILSKQ